MKSRLVYFGISFILLFLAYKLYGSSYIEISVSGQTGTDHTYTLINQASHKKTMVNNAPGHLKMRVPKASYDVLVQNSSASYFSVIKTGAFLKTTRVDAKLQPEKKRLFVGNNPLPCMNYLKNYLISYDCGDYFNSINIHVPATATIPTYVLKNTNLAGRFFDGIVRTPTGTVALIRNFVGEGTDEGSGKNYYSVYRLDNQLKILNSRSLTNLNPAKLYSMRAYGNGFILYDSAFEDISAYSSWKSKPATVSSDGPKEKDVQPASLAVTGSDILKLYSSRGKKLVSEIVALRNGRQEHFILPGQYLDARFCGQQKLCALGDKRLDVYDTASQKPKFQYQVSGARAVEDSTKSLLVVTEAGVLNLNVDNRSGWLDYSLGDYTFNSWQTAEDGYLLNLTNNKSGQVALYVDQRRANADSIDKKIAELQKISDVSAVSVYGKYIYVTPDAGQLVYNKKIKGLAYDQQAINQANRAIAQAIVKLGINTKTYKVISTLK